jgi:RNA polymerase sigma-70 factor (ECF subfamily)
MLLFFSIASALHLRTATPLAVENHRPPFESVYQEHFSFVWRTVRALGVPPAYLDDAVQDVFVIVHRKLGDFKPEASLKSWLFGIARRTAKDYRRSIRRRGVRVSLTDVHLETRPADPHTEAGRNEAVRILDEFAGTLDESRRALFVLSEIEEMPVAEIADILGANPNTLYSRLKLIKQDFAEFVTKRFGIQEERFHG